MSAELRGLPCIYNATNVDVKADAGVTSIIVAAKGKRLSMDFAREADFNAFNDDEGEVFAEAVTNKRKTLSIRVVPYSATDRDTAVANMYAMLPDPGSEVEIHDNEDDDGGGDGWTSPIAAKTVPSNYSVRSARLGRTSEGIATVDLELMAFEQVDITALVA